MTAQTVRLLIGAVAILLALCAWLALSPVWLALAVAAVAFVAGSFIGEAVFRRIASAETVRADLEDRVRNPPR